MKSKLTLLRGVATRHVKNIRTKQVSTTSASHKGVSPTQSRDVKYPPFAADNLDKMVVLFPIPNKQGNEPSEQPYARSRKSEVGTEGREVKSLWREEVAWVSHEAVENVSRDC